MSQQLTPKQIAARAYYQAHKESIKAQKRAKYETKARKPKVMKVVNSSTSQLPNAAPKAKTVRFQEENEPVIQSIRISAEDKVRLAKRRRIEDVKLAKELGLSMEDFKHANPILSRFYRNRAGVWLSNHLQQLHRYVIYSAQAPQRDHQHHRRPKPLRLAKGR